jgi:TolA-binding protein
MNTKLPNRILTTAAFLLTTTGLLTGCLQTRESTREVDEKTVMRRQVQTLQQTTADVNSRFVDLEDDVRKLHGRVEATDQKLKLTDSLIDKGFGMTDAKFKEKDQVYREEFLKMRTEIDGLKAQLAAFHEDQKKQSEAAAQAAAQAQASAMAQAEAKAKEADKNPFQVAEEKFEKKSYREAILDYEKYRKTYPKGKSFAAATYKIGYCFQEMGLSDDARAFYEEVVSKFPKAKETKLAQAQLKKLKK